MSLKVPFNKLITYLFLIALYRLTLDWVYGEVIAQFFAYTGFSWNPASLLFFVSWGLLILFSLLMWPCYLNRENKLSYEILFILHLIALVPFTTMIFAGMCSNSFLLANTLYWLLLICLCTRNRIKTVKITGLVKKIRKAHILLALVLFLATLYVSGRYTGFRLNFDLSNSKIYDLRLEARSYHYHIVLNYITSWSRYLLAILIAYFMRRGNKKWAFVCFFIQLLNFGIDASKSTLFLTLFVIGINLWPKLQYSQLNQLALCGILLLNVFSMFLYLWRGNITLLSLFTRRVDFVPLKLSVHYFDFFATHQPDFFRQSFLRHFGFHSPYPDISFMIGKEYLGNAATRANDGLIADAIANLGWAGLFVLPVLIMIVFRILDRCAHDLDPRILFSVALYAAFTLNSTFLFTVLLTHGLLVIMYLLFCLERDKSASLSDIFLVKKARYPS